MHGFKRRRVGFVGRICSSFFFLFFFFYFLVSGVVGMGTTSYGS